MEWLVQRLPYLILEIRIKNKACHMSNAYHGCSTLRDCMQDCSHIKSSGVTRALIGGGGGGECAYSYIRVLPDGFLLK